MAKRQISAWRSYLSKALIIVGLAVLLIYVFVLVQESRTRGQGRDYYSAISAARESIPQVTGAAPSKEGDTPEEAAPHFDFEALQKIIPGAVAWIRCPGTVIDYPVMQGADNDYYLGHLPNGDANEMGSIFLDYRSAADFSDGNSLIFGHHMKSGDMFGSLENYKEQSYYEEHPVIYLYTAQGDYVIELLAGYVVDAQREDLPRSFAEAADFERYIAEIRQRSTFAGAVQVSAEDKLVSFCTCTYNFSDARFVLVGKLTLTEAAH